MNKKEIKETIKLLETYENGFNKICGSVGVRNLKIKKRENLVICDVILFWEGETERINNCEYNLSVLRGEDIIK